MLWWCPGHVVMVSRSCCGCVRSCCDGVPVMMWRCPGHVVVVVSRSCCDGVPLML